jgi:hypothetical protein
MIVVYISVVLAVIIVLYIKVKKYDTLTALSTAPSLTTPSSIESLEGCMLKLSSLRKNVASKTIEKYQKCQKDTALLEAELRALEEEEVIG